MAGSRTQRNTATKKKEVLEAMKKTLGNVSQSCKMANIQRSTYYRWMKDDKRFREKVSDVEEYTFDFVESELMRQIQEGNTAMIIFYAKTKMKHRGYIERKEVAVSEQPAFIVGDKQDSLKKHLDIIHKRNANAG
jgi:hypothetical protein